MAFDVRKTDSWFSSTPGSAHPLTQTKPLPSSAQRHKETRKALELAPSAATVLVSARRLGRIPFQMGSAYTLQKKTEKHHTATQPNTAQKTPSKNGSTC